MTFDIKGKQSLEVRGRWTELKGKHGSEAVVGDLTPQQKPSFSQRLICSDSCTCCHTEIESTNQACCLTQSQYTDTGLTRPIADPTTPGFWQSNQPLEYHVLSQWCDSTRKKIKAIEGFQPRSVALEADALPLGPTASLAKWLRHPPRKRKVRSSNPAYDGIFSRGRVIPVT